MLEAEVCILLIIDNFESCLNDETRHTDKV